MKLDKNSVETKTKQNKTEQLNEMKRQQQNETKTTKLKYQNKTKTKRNKSNKTKLNKNIVEMKTKQIETKQQIKTKISPSEMNHLFPFSRYKFTNSISNYTCNE